MAWPLVVGSLLLLLALPALALRAFFAHRHRHWRRRGVPEPSTERFPVRFPYGHFADAVWRRRHCLLQFADVYDDWRALAERPSPSPYVGFYLLHVPVLMVCDADVARDVLVRDFAHFSNRVRPLAREMHIIGGTMFAIGGSRWKTLRSRLGPAFTAGKMRAMFDRVARCAHEMTLYLDERTSDGGGGGEHEMNAVMANYANDVMASCAFGIECNSFRDPDELFRRMSRRVLEPTMFEFLLTVLEMTVPGLATGLAPLRSRMFPPDAEHFYTSFARATVEQREKERASGAPPRNDFMQSLYDMMKAGQKGNKDEPDEWTIEQIAAQLLAFLVAGFESSSLTASYALYQMAINPECQDRARAEVDEVIAKLGGGPITFDSLSDMKYLSRVADETLRLYPPLPVLARICTERYTFERTGLTLEKGAQVLVPIYAMQRDPLHFPDPERFDPDRFLPEVAARRHRFAYIPFGEGPRNCIAVKFGEMQTRLGLATFLSKYEVSPCKRTNIPIVYDTGSLNLGSKGGIWLNVRKRKK